MGFFVGGTGVSSVDLGSGSRVFLVLMLVLAVDEMERLPFVVFDLFL